MQIKKFNFEPFNNLSIKNEEVGKEQPGKDTNIRLFSNTNNNSSIILNSFTDKELEERDKNNYNQGVQEGLIQASKEIEQLKDEYELKLNDKFNKEKILYDISSNIENYLEQLQEIKDEFISSIGEISLIMAEIFFNSITADKAKEKVVSLLEENYAFLLNKAKLKIVIHESLLDEIKHELALMVKNMDSKTEIKIIGKSDINIADVKVIWEDGVLKLDNKQIFTQISEKIISIFNS